MSYYQQLTDTIRLELPATFKYLHVLGACIVEILGRENNLEDLDRLSYEVQLGVHEICTNIIQHAYSEPQENERIYVTIEVNFPCRRLLVKLLDTGDIFDQSKVEEPHLGEEQVHGYGLFIAMKLMDEVKYSRLPEGNCWYLVKKL